MGIANLVKIYGAMGAGGLALIVLIWLLIYFITKINPVLDQLKIDNESHKEVIKNNTDAIKEVSRSNQNVAQALSLLENSFGSLTTILERHDIRSEMMEKQITQINENIRKL